MQVVPLGDQRWNTSVLLHSHASDRLPNPPQAEEGIDAPVSARLAEPDSRLAEPDFWQPVTA